ncbi:DinB family protein [Fodinicola acaciae]|uniref:DinB family protein n=1 Tax=Fodinicola acaciae TaxID=2681555 RepID=UPI0013D22D15|nr:DinB family protein [Fodinicola acaciae]
MTEFVEQNLDGARFRNVSLAGARFRNVNLAGASIRGAYAVDLEIDGDVRNLTVNGVDVGPLVEAELNRRDPDRALVFAPGADGMREAWAMLERRWQHTVDRARSLPAELLDERVDDEWSFVETLRHLVFATDAWVLRAYLGQPAPWHPLGLSHEEADEIPSMRLDRQAKPSLEEVLALRADRMATVRQVLADLTDERLAGTTEPVLEPGYPASESYPVERCLRCILIEEWEHRRFAERDLAILTSRASSPSGAGGSPS